MSNRRGWYWLVGLLVLLGTATVAAGAGNTTAAWSTDLGGDIAAQPTAADGQLYVGNGSAVTALDSQTGKQIWSHQMPGRVLQAPAVTEQIVAVIDETGALRTFSPQLGIVGGTYQVEPYSRMATADGTAYICERHGTVHAVTLRDRQARWITELPVDRDTQPQIAVGDTTVIVTDGAGTVYGLDRASGAQRWQTSVSAAVVRLPTTIGERIALATADGNITVLNTDTGTERWHAQVGAKQLTATGAVQSLHVDTHGVVIGTTDGTLYSMAADSVRWQQSIPTAGRMPPRIVNGGANEELLVATDTGTILGVDRLTGEPLWRTAVPGAIPTAPTPGAVVSVGTATGTVVGIDPEIRTINVTGTQQDEDSIAVTAVVTNHLDHPVDRTIRLQTDTDRRTVKRQLPPEEPIRVTFSGITAYEPTVAVGHDRGQFTQHADPREQDTHGTPSTNPQHDNKTTVFVHPESAPEQQPIPGFGVGDALFVIPVLGLVGEQIRRARS